MLKNQQDFLYFCKMSLIPDHIKDESKNVLNLVFLRTSVIKIID